MKLNPGCPSDVTFSWVSQATVSQGVIVAPLGNGDMILGLNERKVMTNLDRILKSRDITLPTEVHLVKAMVFPVVMYGCESWIIKKAEH